MSVVREVGDDETDFLPQRSSRKAWNVDRTQDRYSLSRDTEVKALLKPSKSVSQGLER